jgi:hypothetical protein
MDCGDINPEPDPARPPSASPPAEASPDVNLLSLADKYDEKAATWESSPVDPEAAQGMVQGMSQLSHSVAEELRSFALARLRLKNRSSGLSPNENPPQAGQDDTEPKAKDEA